MKRDASHCHMRREQLVKPVDETPARTRIIGNPSHRYIAPRERLGTKECRSAYSYGRRPIVTCRRKSLLEVEKVAAGFSAAPPRAGARLGLDGGHIVETPLPNPPPEYRGGGNKE